MVYGVSWASYLPKFSVGTIEIKGAKDISPQLLHAYVETKLFDGSHSFLSRTNVLFFPRADIEKTIVTYFPRIRSAEISRASLLARALTVTVQERESYARWCLPAQADTSSHQCYLMDEEGLIFAELAASTHALSTEYIFMGDLSEGASIGQTYLAGQFAGIRALLEKLGQAGYSAQSILAESDQDFSVLLSDGFIVRASFGQDVGVLVRNLELILDSPSLRGKESALEYIDLRFGNRVYYKLKGEAATASAAE